MSTKPTTIKFTTTVEFTPEQWAEYKEALWDNYGEETKTKKDAARWLKQEGSHGIYSHLGLQDMDDVKVTIK